MLPIAKVVRTCLLTVACMGSASAVAEPIKLKLAFHTSDRASVYQAAVKPFVDAVNGDASHLVEIEVFASGALGRALELQPKLIEDGAADIAFVVPGLAPDRFPDTAIIELPGLYRDAREANLVFTRLVASKAIQDYERYFAIGTVVAGPETIHTRSPAASVADLKGRKLRVNNSTTAETLAKLGITGVVMPVTASAESIASGKIDGATVPVGALAEFGIGRLATNHFLLPVGGAPLVLLMNRTKFESLPAPAQEMIRKYSGEWIALQYIAAIESFNATVVRELRTESRRKIVTPSQADMKKADAAFAATVAEIEARNPRYQALVAQARAELAKLRSEKP